MWLSTVVMKQASAHSDRQIFTFKSSDCVMNSVKPLQLLLFCLLLSLFGTAACAQTTIIKFSFVAGRDTPKGKAAMRFKNLIEQSSNHRIQVDLYPNSVLYKENDELEALQLGAVQMLAPSLARLAMFGIKDFEIFDLPFVFNDKAAVTRVTQGPVGRSILRKLEAKGMVGLAYWDNGLKIMSANQPLKMPADFAGKRMRIQSSYVLDSEMEALGAVPQILDADEVARALSAHVVDGIECSPADFYAHQWYKNQTDVTLSMHGYLGYAVIVNKRFWDGLPSDLRRLIENAMQQATVYGNALAAESNEAALAWMKASKKIKVHTLTAKERRAWQRALDPVKKDLGERIGTAIVTATTREAEGHWLGSGR
jgi:C4-dicarboxylate-binding protein DctP